MTNWTKAGGDAAALAELYRLRGPALLAYLTTRLDDRGLAEEVLPDVMLAAWQAAGRFRGQGRVRFHGAPSALIAAAEGQAWEVEIPLNQSPPVSWHIASRVLAAESLRLRVVGEQPDPSARPVIPTLEEAYLALMRGG